MNSDELTSLSMNINCYMDEEDLTEIENNAVVCTATILLMCAAIGATIAKNCKNFSCSASNKSTKCIGCPLACIDARTIFTVSEGDEEIRKRYSTLFSMLAKFEDKRAMFILNNVTYTDEDGVEHCAGCMQDVVAWRKGSHPLSPRQPVRAAARRLKQMQRAEAKKAKKLTQAAA